MPHIPRDTSVDSTLALLMDGYTFISKRCQRYQSNIFQTRLLLQPFICLRGEAAATLFYDNDRFARRGASPQRLQKTLVGQGGVQGLDGSAHRQRKQMLMSLMTPERIAELADLAAEQWRASIHKWERMPRVVLFDEVEEILCRAVCRWAGVPLAEEEVKQRTADFAAMIDGPAAVGPRYWRGKQARQRAEQWTGNLIDQVRTRKPHPADNTALHVIARHRDLRGKLLPTRIAAVELLNVLRPTVAIARFITFAAVALHEHPHERQHVQTGDDAYAELFVQEVRRCYPFFPLIVARVRTTFQWQGYQFPKGRRVLLDLYGTDHDPQIWEQPDAFRPERFRHWNGSAFNFIPQGGGDYYQHHRCAGEWITIALMKVALRMLTTAMTYSVPDQDLRIRLSRMPAIPNSRFVISNVRRT